MDHTYGNLSGHYITYGNSSTSQPLTIFRTKDWISPLSNLIACLSSWFYIRYGKVYYDIELAQGDDLQARLLLGNFAIGWNDPQWIHLSRELFYATRFVPCVLFKNITSSFDIDDLSILFCNSSQPIPLIITMLDCDFDKTVLIQAEQALNYTAQAPEVDYSIGNKKGMLKLKKKTIEYFRLKSFIVVGHYIWLSNSDSLQPGGAGYLSTYFFRFTSSNPIYCLSFQYYRFGLTFETSRLTVLALNEKDQKSVARIWSINPINYTYKNQRWSWAYAPLPVGNYSLLFRIDSDHEVNSSFAIDSISIKSCGYPQRYFSSTSNIEFSCDFHKTVCPELVSFSNYF
ncbi:unnamed protein product [Rotaria sp. Silwood2]|nr:unnamed protein product [Rotaria sp. Silwood2]